MKRVYTLYRVSTKKQVDKDDKNQADIPMQQNACHEFASWQHEWEIVKEFSEMGVSGYKVSAEERDAIQDLKEAALKGEFDVLLVFMFDRIGRMTTMRYRDSYTRADGSVYAVDQLKYCCYHKARKLVECEGHVTYQADRVDEKVCQLMRRLFSGMTGAPEEDQIQAVFKRQMAGNRARQKKLEMQLKKNRTQLDRLQLEIAGHLFNRIEVDRDYNISVEMNMTYQQFCAEWGDGMFLGEKQERIPV